MPVLKEIVSGVCWISGLSAVTMPSPLARAQRFVDSLDADHVLGLRENPVVYDEAVLNACVFHESIIPNLVKNLLLNYRENPTFWAPTFVDPNAPKNGAAPKRDDTHLPRPVVKATAEIVGQDAVEKLAHYNERIAHFSSRLKRLRDPALFGAPRVAEATKNALAQRIKELEAAKSALEAECQKKLEKALEKQPDLFVGSVPAPAGQTSQPLPRKQQLAGGMNYLNELVRVAMAHI
jgi:hypothetical protein